MTEAARQVGGKGSRRRCCVGLTHSMGGGDSGLESVTTWDQVRRSWTSYLIIRPA